MNSSEHLTLLVAIGGWITSVIGWVFIYLSTQKINQKNRKDEIRINYLINAYQVFAYNSNRENSPIDVEQAVADIHLFGTPKQIDLVRKFCAEIVKNESADLDNLIIDLRDSLREELNLERLDKDDRVVWLRFEDNVK